MIRAQGAVLGDRERDMLVSAALSKSPKQVASMALKIESIKDEIVLNLMGFLMTHYSFAEAVSQLPRYESAAKVSSRLFAYGNEGDDEVDDEDDGGDDGGGSDISYQSSAEGDYSGQPPFRTPAIDESKPAAGRGLLLGAGGGLASGAIGGVTSGAIVGGGGGGRFPLSAEGNPTCDWLPAAEASGSRRKRTIRCVDLGPPMSPVPVLSSSTTSQRALSPGDALLCVPAHSASESCRPGAQTTSSPNIPGRSLEPLQLPLPVTSDEVGAAAPTTTVPGAATDAAAVAIASSSLPFLAETPADGRPGYTCTHCGRFFKNADALKFHAAKHLGVEYQCPLCKQILKTSNSYSNHMKMHSGYDGHRCTVCLKHFMRRHELVRHVKIVHMGERPFVCSECGAAFATEWNMLRHRKAMHTAAPPPSVPHPAATSSSVPGAAAGASSSSTSAAATVQDLAMSDGGACGAEAWHALS